MANRFERFLDPNYAGGEGAAPTERPAVSSTNRFARFTQPQQPAAAPSKTPLEQAGFAASRIGTALPHLAEFAVDTPQHLGALAQFGISGEKTGVSADMPDTARAFEDYAASTLGAPDFAKYPGQGYEPAKIGAAYKTFLALPQNESLLKRRTEAQTPEAYKALPMLGSEVLSGQLAGAAEGIKDVTGGAVDLNKTFRGAETPEEQLIEGVVEGVVTGGTGLPRAAVRAAVPTIAKRVTAAEAASLRREIAADLITGGVGGYTGTLAAQNAPEGWEMAAGLAGGLAGGVGAVGAMHGLDAATRSAADYLRPAIPTKGNVERLASDALKAASSDPAAAAEAIRTSTAPEGVRYTAGQAANDTGLLNLEQTLARGKDQEFREAMIERAAEQNRAMVENLRAVEENGSPAAVSEFFASRMNELTTRAAQLNENARRLAEADASRATDTPEAAEVGAVVQDALEAEMGRVRDEIAALDRAIDPSGTMQLPTRALRNTVDETYAKMSPEERLSITPEERALIDIITKYGDVLPYNRFRDLRTQINEDMRNARTAGKGRAYGRMSQLRGALETDIKDAIAGRAARDATTANNFVREARDWYENRVGGEAGARAAASPVGASGAGARSVPDASGAAGARVGEPGAPARDTGLPDDAAARAAVEGGRRFNQGEVIQLGPRREQKELEGFHRDLMGRVADRVALIREATAAAREKGIFEGFNVGDRLRSQNHEGSPLPPMKVEGMFLREWKGGQQARPYERLGIKPTIVEYDGKQYVPMLRVAQGDAPPANLTSKQIDEWQEAHPDAEWSRFETGLDLVRDRAMRGPQKLFQSGIVGDPGAEMPPPFYSAALKSVIDSKTNRASPQQWAATIKNTPGVKQEELDWLGLNSWLAAQKGPVTKEQVADFIRANQIEVEEVNLGGGDSGDAMSDLGRRIDWEADDVDEDFVRELAIERIEEEGDEYRARVANQEDIDPEDVSYDQMVDLAFKDEMRWRTMEPDGYHASVTVDTPEGQVTYELNRDSSGSTSIYVDGRVVKDYEYMDEGDIRDALREDYAENYAAAEDADGPTQYGEYTLPGGKDYHELLLKLPEREAADVTRPSPEVQAKYKDQWDATQREMDAIPGPGKWSPEERARYAELQDEQDALHAKMVEETRSTAAPWRQGENFEAPHYDDQSQNILAHVRFKERTSVDGKRTLFLEEVQSDWHQQGRDKGYIGSEKPADTTGFTATETTQYDEPYWKVADKDGNHFYSVPRERGETAEQAIAKAAAQKAKAEVSSGVPDAPFKTTWPELALKRMIRWAADNGYDQIAWTPGSVQNARYNLSQHINNVQWFSGKGDMAGIRQINLDAANRSRQISLVVDQEGKVVGSPQLDGAINKPLSEVVGKDLAQQIMADAEGQITKAGLAEIGGSGMREFYDRVMVSLGNKLGKKFGTQVGKAEFGMPRGMKSELGIAADGNLVAAALPITPEMREGALRGQPLFQKVHEAATSPENNLPEPSQAQKEAGNYRKGHVKLGGLDLSIENPAGSTRSGTDASGKPWSVDMKDHYGYIKGTTGRDKDHLDVFVSRNAGELNDGSPVFVVNQIDPKTGKFDEHKLMLGYPNKRAAEAAYKANYADDWKGMGSVIPTNLGAVKRWIAGGNTTRPFEQRSIPDAQGNVGAGGVRSVPGAAAPAAGNAGREADGSLRGLPRKIGSLTASAYPDAQRVAAAYMKSAGLEYSPPNTYAKVDPERATSIAEAYDAMEHNPADPEVQRAYKAMADETLAQYQAMLDDGMEIEFIAPGQPDPYAGNPRNMTEDVRNNKHMWVFATRDGFGSDATFDASDNPLLADSGFQISGQPAVINDIFRAVHDYFGHVKEGVGFRADGEENAWRAHSAMYSPEARRAMTSETRGQNSWVNYGPYGESNRTARSEDTHYADQKIGLLPEWVAQEGAGDDTIADTMAQRFARAGRPKREAQAAGQLVDAFYTTLAERLGKPVDDITDQFPLPRVAKGKRAGMGQSGARGSIELGRGKSPSLISMFEKADASTALHESAHHFLDMFARVGGDSAAPDGLKRDWSATNAWWEKNARALAKDAGEGVTPEDVRKVLRGERIGEAKENAITRGMHEQWARAFEVYLRDGKAPNAAMKGLFDQFKDWLTKVYQSITGMGVNVSPDIRGVFDRMLAGEQPAAPGNLIDAAAAKRLSDVTGKWKEFYGTYSDRGANPVPAIVKRSKGETYPHDMPAENVTKAVWRPGPDGAAAIRNVLKAAGSRRDAVIEGIEQSAMLSLARLAMKDGVVDPTKFEAWKAKHADALRLVPNIARKMESAADATREMQRIAAVGEKAAKDVQKTAIGELLRLGPDASDADVSRKVGSIIERQGAVKAVRELVGAAQRDPDALAGLRRATVDHVLSRFGRDDDRLVHQTMRNWVNKHRAALAEVLTPDQMNTINAIMDASERITRKVVAPLGGSPTAEYLSALEARGESPSMLAAVLQRTIGNAVQSGIVGGVGHVVSGMNLGVGINSAIAAFLSKAGLDMLRARGFSKADALLREAILDPALARALLMKPPRRKGAGAAKELERALSAGAIGLLSGSGEADRRRTHPPASRAETRNAMPAGVGG